MPDDSPALPPLHSPHGRPVSATLRPRRRLLGLGPRFPSGGEKTTLGGVHVGPPVIRKTLLFSFWDGIMANGMQALNETFSIAAAIALRSSAMGIACLSSMPLLIGSIAQFLLPAFADPAKGRKYYVKWGVRSQAFFLFLAAFAGWLPEGYASWAFISLFGLSMVSAHMLGPYWMAWMGDLIPGPVRGRHFAWRSVFFSWMYLSCSLVAGSAARSYDAHNTPWKLFACVFLTAAALRTVSYLFLRLKHEPPAAMAPEAFSPLRFRPGRDFVLFCLATGLFQGAAAMSGPFFNVWYLQDLRITYLDLAIALAMTVLGSITFAAFWGRMADNFGPARVLWISGFLIALVPFPYLIFQETLAIWILCFFSGAVWGGYNLANVNHMLNATDKSQRSHYLAFGALVVGVIGCAFTLLGGYLATRLPVLLDWRLRSLFLLSGVLRLAIFFVFFGRFREYLTTLSRNSADVYMELPGFRMGAGMMRTVFRGFRGF